MGEDTDIMVMDRERLTSPDQWAETVASPPSVSSRVGRAPGCFMRRWSDTQAAMDQPKLDHNYVALHLGGAKKVTRDGRGGHRNQIVQKDSITVVPFGQAYRWHTVGPIDYAHYYISPARLVKGVEEIFDKEARDIELIDCIGGDDPLVGSIFHLMLAEVNNQSGSPLFVETLNESLIAAILHSHSTLSRHNAPRKYRLSPFRRHKVEDYVEAHLADHLCLEDLARVAGLSRYHFSRAFTMETGCTPHAYVQHRRIMRAKQYLRESEIAISEIAALCGFPNANNFATVFRRIVGRPPSKYRLEL